MLLSLVLQLTPLTTSRLRGPTGRDTQAWFLRLIQEHDPALAEELHATDGPRPYTTSGLMTTPWRPLTPKDDITSETPCFLRITSLTPRLTTALLEHLTASLPDEKFTIHKIDFHIQDAFIAPEIHPWAGMSTHKALVGIVENRTSKSVRLRFASPTAFRSNGRDICLPLPEHVLRSWWLRWNASAPEDLQIHPDWPKFAADTILVTRLRRLSTVQWRFSGNGKYGAATGFYGDVTFQLTRPPDNSPWREHADGAEYVLHLLAEFAFYAGTGHHTTIGMGQTRPLTTSRA